MLQRCRLELRSRQRDRNVLTVEPGGSYTAVFTAVVVLSAIIVVSAARAALVAQELYQLIGETVG